MTYLVVKNWAEFQHYKDRNPPWIKLHRTLLDDYEFACLQDASKLHLMLIWLLASQSEGRVPDDPKFLQGKLGLRSAPDLQPLIKSGFLIAAQSASNALAPDASNLRLETEAYKASEDNMSGKPDVPDLTRKSIEIIEFLNAAANRAYRPVKSNVTLISARLKEGATVEDCKAVITSKCGEWSIDPKMCKYLRPETLFNATKFAQYIGETETGTDWREGVI